LSDPRQLQKTAKKAVPQLGLEISTAKYDTEVHPTGTCQWFIIYQKCNSCDTQPWHCHHAGTLLKH